MERLHRKIEGSRDGLPQPVINSDANSKVGIISYGSNDPAILEAQDLLAAQGIHTNYMRIRALPLSHSVMEFVRSHERVYVIENNFDGQMAQLIRMETSESTQHMTSLPLGDGLPMTAEWVVEQISTHEGK
jgi:2-oxoglutarate ferredoxin oxidoreductase subunit alpha